MTPRLLPAASSLLALFLPFLLGCHGAATSTEALAPTLAAEQTPLAEQAPLAEKTPLERLIELGRSDNHVQEHLRHLCLEIGPRLTGSSGLQEACEWARDTFESFGLEARIERWGEFPVGFDRGPWRGAMVAPEPRELECSTSSWSAGTNGPARGPALAFPASEEQLTALEERIAGAWLVRPPTRAAETESGESVFAKPEQPSSELVKKVRALILEKGGLGELSGARNELLVTSGNSRISWDELPRLVRVRLTLEAHNDLWRRMLAEQAVELEFDIDNRFVQGPVDLYNVVADLPGTTNPDEYVIVCGHLDSWDGAQGAVDNGTGCATTIEAARLLVEAGIRPERTIRFILWSGEEQGLLGSRAYVEQHAELMDKISAVLNHDGGTNYLAGLGVTAAMMPAMQQACAPLMGLDPELPFELKEVDGLPTAGSSDHAAFLRAGAPGFFWNQEGRSDYEHYHHTQFDTFESAIPEYQEHSALVAAITAWGLADLPELLDRTRMKAPDPRRMGVFLEGTKIARVVEDSRAGDAGLLAGDQILSIDGEEIRSRGQVTRALRAGPSLKVLEIKRGEETLEVTLDWSDDPDEARRLEIIEERAQRDAERAAERDAKRAARRKAAAGG